jgi:hypothetical protein
MTELNASATADKASDVSEPVNPKSTAVSAIGLGADEGGTRMCKACGEHPALGNPRATRNWEYCALCAPQQ